MVVLLALQLDFISSNLNVVTVLRKNIWVAAPRKDDIANDHICNELASVEECNSIDYFVAGYGVNSLDQEKIDILAATLVKNTPNTIR